MATAKDSHIPTRFTPQAARNIANAYERLHLQHPNLSHNDLLRKILLDLQEFMSRFSPSTAERLTRFHESLATQPQTLGQFAFNLGLTDLPDFHLAEDEVTKRRWEALSVE